MAKKQWDLTETEKAELVVRAENRMGRVKLLEALQRQLGLEARAEVDWWELLKLRLKIPKEDDFKLIADAKLGKVWVKGEVEELDNVSQGVQDNPYSP